MMIQEFNNLTGFYPTPELYAFIEAEYVDGPWKDKQEFCKAYVINQGGLAEKISRAAHEAHLQEEASHEMALDVMRKTAKDWHEEADRLQKELDIVLEWKPFIDENEYSDEDYNKLYNQEDVQRISEMEAKKLIADEFGFDEEKIQIQSSKDIQEIDKYRRTRVCGHVSRAPLYFASDWNYVRFTVCGYDYEMQDGELRRL